MSHVHRGDFVRILTALPLLASVALPPAHAKDAEDEKAGAAPLERVFDKKILDQNWDWETREDYWFRSQGSQLIPYAWFLALEEAESELLFRRDENIDALRFVTSPPSPRNPDGLPVGFAKDPNTDWVGFTCAACHTGQVDFEGTSMVVDGAPTLANFDLFLERMVVTLKATLKDADKRDRFANKVLGGGHSKADKVELIDQVEIQLEVLKKRVAANAPGRSLPDGYPGFGRLDAYTEIFNQVTAIDLGVPDNVDVPNGPASYPFLWGAPWSDRVQWNGAGKNRKIAGEQGGDALALLGPLVRNTVEVIGVFGRLDFDRDAWLGYDSRADLRNLGLLERSLCTLHAPKWPENVLGKLDQKLADQGGKVYQAWCQRCHERIPDETPYEARMKDLADIETDVNYAKNAHDRDGKTGSLEGRRINVLPVIGGEKFGKEAKSHEMLRHAVVGVILRNPIAAYQGMKAGQCGPQLARWLPREEQRAFVIEALSESIDALEVMPVQYKARPLNGIWATAPYLHNGSIPNLKEFLEAPEDRVKRFYVGNREYDPVNAGFVTTKAPNTTLLDTTVQGNSNAGHPFMAELSDAERRQLLEFLKTL